jgi:hypothetical protein
MVLRVGYYIQAVISTADSEKSSAHDWKSIDEWMKKTWHMYTTEDHSVTQNEISFVAKWMEMEDNMLN